MKDIEPEVIASYSNNILTAIVHGMKSSEPNEHVRLAATNALLNSLEFTKQNFDRETERHFIMQVCDPFRIFGQICWQWYIFLPFLIWKTLVKIRGKLGEKSC